MTRTIKLLVIGLLAGISLQATAAEKRPNFLLIIADDLTWSDLGFTGNTDVHTPHLDSLRKESLYLPNMFDSAAMCSPSRNSLYTGLYCVRAGAYPNHTRVYDGTKSVFTYLKRAGYRVALQNKEHVGPKESFPYEHIQGADDLTETTDFIKRDADQPWMLVYCSNDPHTPWNRGPRELYDPKKLKVPPYLHDNAKTRELLAQYYAEISMLDIQVGNLMKLLEETNQAEETLVMFITEQGSAFPYGGKWSLYDNGIKIATLVRWPGHTKANSTNEALVQYVDITPTFLAAAGLKPEKLKTGCPDANGELGFDGRSFLDVIHGKTDTFRDVIYSQVTTVGVHGYEEPYPMRAARDARFKYIRNLASENTYSINGIHKVEPLKSWAEDAKNDPKLAARVDWLFHRTAEELYDLEKDPLEMHNLAGDPKLADVQARLSGKLDAWMAQQGDKGMETELKAKERQGPGRQGKGGKGKKQGKKK